MVFERVALIVGFCLIFFRVLWAISFDFVFRLKLKLKLVKVKVKFYSGQRLEIKL